MCTHAAVAWGRTFVGAGLNANRPLADFQRVPKVRSENFPTVSWILIKSLTPVSEFTEFWSVLTRNHRVEHHRRVHLCSKFTARWSARAAMGGRI